MARWIVDAVALTYQAQGVPCPLRLHAHSTRGVVSSWALVRGALLTDICRSVDWATPNTIARFYSLRVGLFPCSQLRSEARRGPDLVSACCAYMRLLFQRVPTGQTLLSQSITLRQPDVAERLVPGLYSVVSLRTGFRLGSICVTLRGSHMCYSTVFS